MKSFYFLFILICLPLAAQENKPPIEGNYTITKMAFETAQESLNSDIMVMTPNSKPKKFVVGTSPIWSPDGTQLAFCVRGPDRVSQIEVINSDGSGLVQLTRFKDGACPSDWSPDGQKIVGMAYGKQTSIFTITKDGKTIVGITEGYGAHWSPDGKQLLFCRYPSGRGTSGSLWIVNLDGSGAKKIIDDDSTVLQASWFPDSKTIAFTSEREHRNKPKIYRVSTDGSGLEVIPIDRFYMYFPVLSPDAKQLVADGFYEIGSSDQLNIVLVDLATQHATILAHGVHPSVIWGK